MTSIAELSDEGLTVEDREHLKLVEDEFMRVRVKILDAMHVARESKDNPVRYTQGTADGTREAISLLLVQMFFISFAQRRERKKLEARIVELEEAATRP